MLATAIIVFREVLEAALIVSILMAATATVPRRNIWIAAGIAAGLAGACAVAASASVITEMAQGMGQEILNAAILLIAVAMLSWHTIWMASHGREIGAKMKGMGKAVSAGQLPMYAISLAVGMAVLREGAETVLFLYGIAHSEGLSLGELAAGGLAGAGFGALAGLLLYRGLLHIPARHLFAVTNWMIIFVTAGLATQAAGFLVQADILPPIVPAVWDTSGLLSEASLPGRLLHTLVGYEARPAAIQVIVYLGVLFVLGYLSLAHRERPAPLGRAAAIASAFLIWTAIDAGAARAEFKMRYPNIDYREVEIENNVSKTFDHRADKNHNYSFPTEVGVGILPTWFAEIEFEGSKVPDERASLDAVTFESYFMLTEPGKYWLDASIFAEYSRSQIDGDPDGVTLGLLLQKEQGKWLHTANLYWEKEVGSLATQRDGFLYSWQTRYMLNPLFQPGFEIYGEIEDLNHPGPFEDQQFRIGPMFAGSYNLGEVGGKGKIKYEAGLLFGATTETEDRTLRTRIEYEIPF